MLLPDFLWFVGPLVHERPKASPFGKWIGGLNDGIHGSMDISSLVPGTLPSASPMDATTAHTTCGQPSTRVIDHDSGKDRGREGRVMTLQTKEA